MCGNSRKQISNSARIVLNNAIKDVFPLFTPLGEKKWVKGWNPEFLFPINGDFQENLVFRTKSSNDIEKIFNWIISYLSMKDFLVVYTVFTENRVWTIKVKCKELEKNKTTAEIKYTFTGLNEKGDSINRDSLKKMYKEDLKDWETAVNYFFKTGKMMSS